MNKTVSDFTAGSVTVTTVRKTLYDLVWPNSQELDPARMRPQIGIKLKADAGNGAAVTLRHPTNGGGGFKLAPGFEIDIPLDDTKNLTLVAVSGNQTVHYVIQ